jgi:hypothetical protein
MKVDLRRPGVEFDLTISGTGTSYFNVTAQPFADHRGGRALHVIDRLFLQLVRGSRPGRRGITSDSSGGMI